MCTFKWIAVTNRTLCEGPLTEQVAYLADSLQKPDILILREKDVREEEYRALALQVKDICEKNAIEFIPHSFYHVAEELQCNSIHLPLYLLEKMQKEKEMAGKFSVIGASVHSVEEAVQAYNLGATYVTAGHIFPTDCKKGLPARGLEFLKAVCDSVPIPVYAIGGIKAEHEKLLQEAGAKGGCRMSDYMKKKEKAGRK